MKQIKGIPASSGRVSGKTFRVSISSGFGETEHQPAPISAAVEIKQFVDASALVKEKLHSHIHESRIFVAYLELLDEISDHVIATIEKNKVDAIGAIKESCSEICALFTDIDDEYLRSRSDDIVDVCRQLIFTLRKNSENPFFTIPAHSILIVDNLSVTDTVLIDKSKLAGIALREGSKTSHVAILARDHAIPLVLGIGDAIDTIPDDELAIIDGDKGVIMIELSNTMLPDAVQTTIEKKEDSAPAITQDGFEVKVYANAGSLADVKKAISAGADGVGLLRTEFIFMQATTFPDEEQQYALYVECAKVCRERTITIRTLDTGADKPLPYIPVLSEANPAFGLRGIRFSLAHPNIFKVQMRAILRASILGNVRIMYPMITSLGEYISASALLETCKSELKSEGVAFDPALRAGMMIETPAAVLLVDEFAQHATFFSIGVNDLTQYILAVDRNNPYAENACDYYHDAVVKSISEVMVSSGKYGIDATVCGEMASDMCATDMLLKRGVRKLSVSGSQIPFIKEQIRKIKVNSRNSKKCVEFLP